jgi:hypothetical protein
MTFVNKLNFKEDGHLIIDEIITLQDDRVHKLSHHNLINNSQLEVWTGIGKTGTQITDFIIRQNSEKSWVSEVVFGLAVSLATYYVTYYSQGDRNDADDINTLHSLATNNNERLVTRYVHSGNKVIQPTSVNLLTGVFTTNTPIGLTAGTTKSILVNYINGYPTRLFAEWNGTNNYSIQVIDDYSFYVTIGSTIITYADTANNQGVQLDRFVFEYDVVQRAIDLTGLDIGDEIRVVIAGVRDRNGWSYTPLWFNHSGGTSSVDLGMVDGRDFITMYMEKQFRYYREMGLLITMGGRSASRLWSGGTSWQYTSGLDASRSLDVYHNVQWVRLNINFNMGNGSVLEIYTINKV